MVTIDRARARSGWRRSLPAIVVIVVGLGLRPLAVRACTGDCDGDGTVTVNELVTAVNIALGLASLSTCTAIDTNGDGTVTINELVAAVNSALTDCAGGPTITLTGSCAAPGHGSHGLKPCNAGTPVTVFRCNDRTQCLHQQALTMVGATTVADGGGWSVQIAPADASAALVFQASIENAVVYRALGFGNVGASLRAGLNRAASFAPVDITPVTEAGVDLLDMNGFANYSDTGAQQVVTAVEQATANLSFDGLTPDAATALALNTASADRTVMMVLQTGRNTPTPTGTDTSAPPATATGTPPPTATWTATPTGTLTPTTAHTSTPANTGTATPIPAATATPTAARTHTPIPTDTPTATSNATAKPTATRTPTAIPTGTATATPTSPPIATATATATRTDTPIPSATATATPTATPTSRFTDNGDGTVTDTQTGLIWEKKDQGGAVHDVNAQYVWAGFCSDSSGDCQPDAAAAATCTGATGGAAGCAQCGDSATCNTDGYTTIWDWLNQLNAASFAGHSDWRIPTVGQDGGAAELETIVDLSAPGCGSGAPCIPSAFDAACQASCPVTSCSCTQANYYWSATTLSSGPAEAWIVNFYNGDVVFGAKTPANDVRAVRGGL